MRSGQNLGGGTASSTGRGPAHESDRHRRAVLGLVQELGGRLRTSGEIAQALTLTVSYADRTKTTRSRSVADPPLTPLHWPPSPANSSPGLASSAPAYVR
ncbi:DinB/UmuC family translesion DNA polymerase [Streptomyces rubiginosohelvolus]|uniref:DinB/UmuC family translesion DNA polymerase n=1 Tax=Streptomyces rubiginosohelvolus TaxID=67362 RepID=UPI003F9097B7